LVGLEVIALMPLQPASGQPEPTNGQGEETISESLGLGFVSGTHGKPKRMTSSAQLCEMGHLRMEHGHEPSTSLPRFYPGARSARCSGSPSA